MEQIKRLRFWIIIGLVVVASGVAFGIWFLPLSRRANADASEWTRKAEGVEAYARKLPNVRTQASIDEARKAKEAYEAQLGSVVSALGERDRLLERYIPDPETGAEEVREGGVWKGIYDLQMTALDGDIRKSFQSAPEAIVIRKAYGAEWPEEQEMRQEAKRYWVQKYLLEALADVNKVRMVVPALEAFSLPGRPDRLLAPSHGKLFSPIAFEFQIGTQFENVPLVLERLLKCEVGVAITALTFQRSLEGGGGATETGPPPAARSAGAAPAASVRGSAIGPPAGLGPPAGIPFGPPAGQEFGRAAAQAAIARATGGASRPTGVPGRGPSAVRAPTRPTGQQPAAGAPALPRDLVDVTIRGYILDYKAPAAANAE